MTAIVQWNCRGLLRNLDDVEFLLGEHQPLALCLQETHLNAKHKNFLRRYQVFRKDREDASVSAGGVAVVVQKHLPCCAITLNTALEAVAVRLLFHKVVTLCSLYIPPSFTLSTNDFNALLHQLPEPFLLLGDFNAHNFLWGSDHTDARGRIIESILMSHSLCLFNTGEPTYFSPSSLSSSCNDLSIGSASIFTSFT